MPRLSQGQPKYRHHKASKQAVVTLGGRDHYLGSYGSAASKTRYNRLIGEWLQSDRRAVAGIDYDEVHGHRFYRVPFTNAEDLTTDRDDWIELTSGLVDANGDLGEFAFEIIAFMAQSNAAPLGTKALLNTPFDFDNINIAGLGLAVEGTLSPYFAGSQPNHSFQFHHDAAATWEFWKKIKEVAGLDAAY
jgi:hypothetical protein